MLKRGDAKHKMNQKSNSAPVDLYGVLLSRRQMVTQDSPVGEMIGEPVRKLFSVVQYTVHARDMTLTSRNVSSLHG
eukprot:2463471-Amphidinium_carterae.1